MEAQPLSAADVAAVTDRRDAYGYGDGFGCGGAWIWVILLFAIFGFGGNGWGRNGNGLTQVELQNGFDTQSLLRGQEGIKNGLCDGFYAQNTTMLQGFNGLGREVLDNRFEASKCCCETNRNIDAVRYEAAQNTCAITTNATANTQKILDKLCNMEMNAKDQRIADLTAGLQTAQFQLSQQAQNNTLINALGVKPPVAAYLTCSPYQSQMLAFNAYGNGCGNNFGRCGCGNFA